MKKTISALICMLFLSFSTIPLVAAGTATKYFYDGKWHTYNIPPVRLQINGEEIKSDMPPIMWGNSTLVPARAVFEKLGAKVTWDSKKSQVGVSLGKINILLTINSVNALVNGSTTKMPVPPKLINGSTMIPARFVAETLGMNVGWKNDGRIVTIDKPDITIDSITGSNNGSKSRITISANAPIITYTTTEINDNPRLAIDIKNALFKCPSAQVDVNGTYVYRVRGSQYDINPNTTRIVADLKQWTGYSITLSSDKKQMYIDFSNDPAAINSISFSKTGSADSINISMKYPRDVSIFSSDGNKVVVDIPMASASSVQKSLYTTDGRYVKSIQCQQYDATTARLVINTSGISLLKTSSTTQGATISFISPDSLNMSYKNNDHPSLSFKSDLIGVNYFEYKYKTEGNIFTVSIPSDALSLSNGRLLVYDGFIDYIDFTRNNGSGFTNVVINGKKPLDYRINSVADNNVLTVDARTAGSIPVPVGGGTEVLNPLMAGKIVVIDPGHGGDETGAEYNANPSNPSDVTVKEKDINLDISLRLFTLLKNAGVDARMTRQDDRHVDLYDRANYANQLNASLFISVHNNAGNSGENGTMALFYPSSYDSYGITGERFAQIAEDEMLKKLGTTNRGIWKRPRLAVLNATRMPAIITESAYITNSSDRQKLLTDSFRQSIAEALCNAVIKALNEMAASQNSGDSTRTASQETYNTGPYSPGDYQPRNINGFSVPAKAASKCDYEGKSPDNPSMFDLSVKLDYTKERLKIASLDDQRNEARQVLLSKLDTATVDKIMALLGDLKDTESFFWEEEMGNSQYEIWVRCIRYSGVATVDIRRR